MYYDMMKDSVIKRLETEPTREMNEEETEHILEASGMLIRTSIGKEYFTEQMELIEKGNRIQIPRAQLISESEAIQTALAELLNELEDLQKEDRRS